MTSWVSEKMINAFTTRTSHFVCTALEFPGPFYLTSHQARPETVPCSSCCVCIFAEQLASLAQLPHHHYIRGREKKKTLLPEHNGTHIKPPPNPLSPTHDSSLSMEDKPKHLSKQKSALSRPRTDRRGAPPRMTPDPGKRDICPPAEPGRFESLISPSRGCRRRTT